MRRASALADGSIPAESAPHGLDDNVLRSLLGYQLRRADLAMQQAFAREIGEPLNLRQVEFSVLALIEANEAAKHKQISEVLGVAPSNMVGVMSALEQRGLIARHHDPADGRSFFWQLTEQGQNLERRAAQAVAEMERERLGAAAEPHADFLDALDGLWSAHT